jgi:hypothetical protein
MAFLGYCAPGRVPVYCLQGLADREEAIAVLAELSLIKHDPFEDGVPAVSVHRLVQAVARHRTEAKGTAEATIERVGEGLSLPPPPSRRTGMFGKIRGLILQMRPFPHQQHLLRYQLQHSASRLMQYADKYEQAADRLHAAGHSDRAVKAREKAAELREKASRFRTFKFRGRLSPEGA